MTLNWITPIKKVTGISTVTILPIREGGRHSGRTAIH